MGNGHSWKKTGITMGIVLAVISLLLSTFAYSDPDIRDPEGVSDFKALYYPNVLLGLPAFLGIGPIAEQLVSTFYRTQPYPKEASYEDVLKLREEDNKTTDNKQKTVLFITLFVVLTIYWFIVGVFIGWIYCKLLRKTESKTASGL